MEGLLAGGTIANGVQVGINDAAVGNFPTVSAATANVPGNVATLKTATNAVVVYINSAQSSVATATLPSQAGAGAITPAGYYDILGAGTNGTLYSIIGQNTLNAQLYFAAIFGTGLSDPDRIAVETQNTGAQPAVNAWAAEWPPQLATGLSTSATITNPQAAMIYGQPYGNGTYVISASSFNGTNYPVLAFDKLQDSAGAPATGGGAGSIANAYVWVSSSTTAYAGTGNTYSAGTYTTANIVGLGIGGAAGSVAGEWLQIQLPAAIYLQSYAILSRTTTANQYPVTWYLVASNDGATWYLADYRTTQTFATAQTVYYTAASPATAAFAYYRLIITQLSAGSVAAAIAELRLFGNQYPIYKVPGYINFKPTPTFALDMLSPAAVASAKGFYSVRRLFSQWTAPVIQIRRSTDSATLDFYGDQYGTLLSATGVLVQNFIGTGTGYVTVWYDQSGRGNNATQTLTGNQPTLDWVNALVDFRNPAAPTTIPFYFVLPGSTLPLNTALFTLCVKHGIITNYNNGSYQNGFMSGGTNANKQSLEFYELANFYDIDSYNGGFGTSSTYAVGNIMTAKQITTGSAPTTLIYQNGILNVTNTTRTGLIGSISANDYLGAVYAGGPAMNGPLNGQMYFASILASAVSTLDQTIVESQSNFADPYYANVCLLMHCDYDFTDISQYAATLTVSGTAPTINTATAAAIAFGAGSLAFGGAGYLMTPANPAAYNFGSQNFTIEFWMYITTVGTSTYGIIDGSTWRILFVGGYFIFQCYGNNVFITSSTSTFANATKYHVAVVRNGNNISVFQNGVLLPTGGTGIFQSVLYTSTILIGGASYGSSPAGTYLDEIRITNGVARYTAPFTPRAQPFGPLEWPPVQMTSAALTGQSVAGAAYGNGTYTVTSSSILTTSYYPYFAFDKVLAAANEWASAQPTYNNTYPFQCNTGKSLGGVSGEWLMIQLPAMMTLTGYSLVGDVLTYVGQSPQIWTILGSNNNSSWFVVDTRNYMFTSTTLVNQMFTLPTTTQPYSYYAIVVNNIQGGVSPNNRNLVVIVEWKLFGY